ncbi:MAG: hypothetical protein ACRCUY_05015 [Thermoguttaceae bacterium]
MIQLFLYLLYISGSIGIGFILALLLREFEAEINASESLMSDTKNLLRDNSQNEFNIDNFIVPETNNDALVSSEVPNSGKNELVAPDLHSPVTESPPDIPPEPETIEEEPPTDLVNHLLAEALDEDVDQNSVDAIIAAMVSSKPHKVPNDLVSKIEEDQINQVQDDVSMESNWEENDDIDAEIQERMKSLVDGDKEELQFANIDESKPVSSSATEILGADFDFDALLKEANSSKTPA